MPKRYFKKSLLAALLAASGPAAFAQITGYTFSQAPGTYTALTTGGVPVAAATAISGSTASLDNGAFAVSLPFSYTFNGTAYTAAHISANGYLTFGGTGPSASGTQPLGTATTYSGAIAGMGREIRGVMLATASALSGDDSLYGLSNTTMFAVGQPVGGPAAIPAGTTIAAVGSNYVLLSAPVTATILSSTCSVATARIDTATTGVAGSRVFTVQWKGFNPTASGLHTFLNFQIKLHESPTPSDNLAQVVYGPQSAPSTSADMNVGIRGAYAAGTTYYQSRDNDSTVALTNWWDSTMTGTTATASIPFSATIKPTLGLTYQWNPPAPCAAPPTGLSSGSITGSLAVVSWLPVSGVSTYNLEYSAGTGAGGGVQKVYGLTTPPYTLTGLVGGTVYRMHIRSVCAGGDSSALSPGILFSTLPTNDSASTALSLVVNGGCNVAQYDNTLATHLDSLGSVPYEPAASCNSVRGFQTLWFKFAAPAGGAVRISTDYGGSLLDSRIGLFSAVDSSNYSTFTEISCDDDNGTTAGRSMIYHTGLTPGEVYYVQVGKYSSVTTPGTFCLTVDSLEASMLSVTGMACGVNQDPVGGNTTYRKWITLVDDSAKLVALVRQPITGHASPVGITSASTVHTGAVRREYGTSGRFYLNRNYTINWSPLNADVRLVFRKSELDSLQATDGVSSTPAALTVLRQTGSVCRPSFDSTAGVESEILPATSGTAGGVCWVTFTTPGFSNFYLLGGAVPLAADGLTLRASMQNGAVHTAWTTNVSSTEATYTLERSADGQQYRSLAAFAGGKTEYTWEDEEATAPVVFYRVRVTGAAGAAAFSNAVRVDLGLSATAQLEVYPNPAAGAVHIRTASAGTLTLTDLYGRSLQTMDAGAGEHAFDLSGYPRGLYLLRFSGPQGTETVKLQKD